MRTVTTVSIGFRLEVPTRISHRLLQHQRENVPAHLKMFFVSLAFDTNFEGWKLCMKESINLRRVSQRCCM